MSENPPDGNSAENALRQLRHELRTPLNQIIGYSELLIEEAADRGDTDFVPDLEKIRAAGTLLLGRINGLIDVPKNIPLASVARPSSQPLEPPTKAQPNAERGHLLVVDDNPGNRDMLSRRLRRDGHTVVTAADGYEALDRLASSEPFDLVLLDIMMPGIDGIAVLERIKADPTLQHLPVIMISALDEIESVVRCIGRGAEDYLPKPFDPTLLRARIGASLEKKRLRDRERVLYDELRANYQKLEELETLSERLLHNILPAPIVERLRVDPGVIAEHFTETTVLFADLVDFTPLSSRMSPEEVVLLLNEVFSQFDHLAQKHGLEKIKTIGDAYMAVGGLPAPRDDHAVAVAELALDMLGEIERLNAERNGRPGGIPLRLRVGIHTGPVVAGVIGTHKFAYDLWGDTVNLASRMESHGEAGGIHTTAATYRRLCHAYDFEPRGLIPIKGQGEISTFLLRGRKQERKAKIL